MSFDVTSIGKLIPVSGNKEELNELEQKAMQYYDKCKNIKEIISDYLDEYIVIDGNIFRINEYVGKTDDPYVQFMQKNDDGSYTYVMSYNNSGTCLGELLEEEYENLNRTF